MKQRELSKEIFHRTAAKVDKPLLVPNWFGGVGHVKTVKIKTVGAQAGQPHITEVGC